jgi:hypothetical protein
MLNSFKTTVATPRKWPGTKRTAQGPGEFFHGDPRLEIRRIERSKETGPGGGNPFPAAESDVAGERARVSGKIFPGTELGGVHENRNDHLVVFLSSAADERGMAFVQRAHGGHQSHATARPTPVQHGRRKARTRRNIFTRTSEKRVIKKSEDPVLVVASPHFGQFPVPAAGHGPEGFGFPRPIEQPLAFCGGVRTSRSPCKRNRGRGAIR